MSRILHLLWLSIWRSSLQWWSRRSFLITIVIGRAVTPLLGLIVWSAALPGNSAVTTYYVVLLAVQLMTVSFEHHTLSNGIYAGNLGGELLAPKPVVLGYLGENFALRLWHLVFGMPLVVLAGALVRISIGWATVVAAIPALIVAAGLRFAFTYALALSALWTERAHGVVGFGETLIFLLGGTAAPLSFLSEPVRSIGQLLPFWSMLGMPAEIAAGTLRGSALIQAYLVQVSWFVAVTGLAVGVWRVGIRRFTALGG